MLIVVRREKDNPTYDAQLWTNSTASDLAIPMIHLIPFQRDAPLLYCIQPQTLPFLQRKLQERQWRFQRVADSHIRYACHQRTFDQQAFEYMIRTKAYIILNHLIDHPDHQVTVHQLLDIMVERVKELLHNLCARRWITSFQHGQMDVQRSTVRLDYLFFVPKTSHIGPICFEPMTISALSPLMPISRYLHRLLEPLYYNPVVRTRTVFKGADIVPTLEKYQQNGFLRPTTLFVTVHIKDPYASITHPQLLHTLHCFFRDFLIGEHVENMNVSGFLELTNIVLQHQYFIYNNTIYQQMLGGSTGLYLIELLINIYLFYWQQPFLFYNDPCEVFVRCFDQIFFTWNQSEEKLQQLLAMIKGMDASIQWTSRIQTHNMPYLDVQLSHHNGLLHTQVYHDWRYEPYVLPYMYGGSSISTINILRTALIRAVLCCFQWEDFEEEQQYIETAFLFNQFSLTFIRKHIDEFFLLFGVMDLSIHRDQSTYNELRRYVRQFDQQQTEEKIQRCHERQKQCIWYIHSKLKGLALVNAKRNVRQHVPTFLADNLNIPGVKVEIVSVPDYPATTI